jgi:hypothetical protein
MTSYKDNIGAYIKTLYASHKNAIVAGSGTDNSAVTGQVIDRNGYNSAQLNVGYAMTLTTDKAAALTVTVAQSDDNSSWGSAAALITAEDIEDATTGGAVKDVYSYDIDLSGYKRYLKFYSTLNLAATQTDTAEYVMTCTLGGADVLPAT